jgi:lipoprotein-anchoring transpeptidase ErfK/SrfK
MIGQNSKVSSKMRAAAAALMGAGAALLMVSAAQAQSTFWDWGGSQTVGGAGKQTVRFPGNYRPGELVVSFGDRRVYHITGPGVASAYPIAIPREQSRWQGVTTVSSKRENPSWTPTPTMRAENPRLPMWVPGGHPMNPLGVRAMYLGSSTYRIHGTDAPWTIGSAVSKGCVRMYNQDVLDLYPRVNVGAKVTVTWQKFPTGVAMAATAQDVTAAQVAPKKSYLRPMQARRAVRVDSQSE